LSAISPRLSVVNTAEEPIGKPTAFSHSPQRTSIGTLICASLLAVIVADEIVLNDSGIAERGGLRFLLRLVSDADRALFAMPAPRRTTYK
jgi:hypothetical protein